MPHLSATSNVTTQPSVHRTTKLCLHYETTHQQVTSTPSIPADDDYMSGLYGLSTHPGNQEQKPAGTRLNTMRPTKRRATKHDPDACHGSTLQLSLEALLADMDEGGKLRATDRRQLAANIFFLVALEKGEAPRLEDVKMVVLSEEALESLEQSEGDVARERFRLDVWVEERIVVEGEPRRILCWGCMGGWKR